MSGYYYLATPYTKYPEGTGQAFIDACKIAAKLMDLEIPIFCPIAHTHPIASFTHHDPLDSTFWQKIDHDLMLAAKGLIVVQMESWEISSGVLNEIRYFEKAEKPIYYLFPSDFGIEKFLEWLKEQDQ